jgi:hypothetical protein
LPSVAKDWHNVAVAENKAFGAFCAGCIVTPTDIALCCEMLLAQKIGYFIAPCTLSLKLHDVPAGESSASGAQKILPDAIPPKYFLV